MATNIARLNVQIVGDGKALRVDLKQNEAALRKFGRTTTNLGKQFTNFGKQLVAGLGLAALGTGLSQVIRLGAEFNRTFQQSTSILGLTGDQFSRLSDRVLEVAGNFEQSASELARVVFQLGSAGLKSEEISRALPTFAEFAQAGNFQDAELAASRLLGILGAFGEGTDQARHFGNVIIASMSLGLTSTEQLLEGLTKLGPTAAAMGISFEQSNAAILGFSQGGVKGSEAATAAEKSIIDLAEAQRDNAAAFKAAEIDIFTSLGTFRDFSDISNQLSKSFGDLSSEAKLFALAQLGLNKETIKAVVILAQQEEILRKVDDRLESVAGTMKKTSQEAVTGFDKQMTRITGTFSKFGASIAGSKGVLRNLTAVADTIFALSVAVKVLTRDVEGLTLHFGPDESVQERFRKATIEIEKQEKAQERLAAAVKKTGQAFVDALGPISDVKLAVEGPLFIENIIPPIFDELVPGFLDLSGSTVRQTSIAKDIGREVARASSQEATRLGSIGELASRLAGLDATRQQDKITKGEQEQIDLLDQQNDLLGNVIEAIESEIGDVNLTVREVTLP